jgi:hypothetical protein
MSFFWDDALLGLTKGLKTLKKNYFVLGVCLSHVVNSKW